MVELWDAWTKSDMLAPHGYCLLWKPELLWSHVVGDLLIGSAYMSIPIVLALFVRKRTDIAYGWVFWCFVLFILACGTTHFFSIWTLWNPDYGIEAILKLLTAGVSVATAFVLWPLLPKALALPSPERMRAINADLEARIRERDVAMDALERETAERFKVEAALLQSRKMEALGQLTGGIAHDFNNLLTVIRGSAEMLQRSELAPGRREVYLKGLEDAADRAARLTSQLLAFSRRNAVSAEVVELNQLLDAISDLVRQSLGPADQLEFDLSPDLWRVEIDRVQFEMAVLNLAVNARDAMPDGGRFTVSTRNVETSDGDVVEVRLSDSGSGMPAQVVERAFEPFFTTKGPGKGTGLGLAQVYGFAQSAGGAARIETEDGKGASVVLTLPRSARETEAPTVDDVEPLIVSPGGSILLVEDNATVAQYAEGLLTDLGFTPVLARNGEEALDQLSLATPRAVVSDIVMPVMDGLELARRLRSNWPELPVILATGYSDATPDRELNVQLLRKPFTRSELVRALNRALVQAESG